MHHCHWWHLALLLCTTIVADSKTLSPSQELIGPAKEAPVIVDSEKLSVSEIPMEHRSTSDDAPRHVLPNVREISTYVYQRLGVNLFFSMWLVFLNDDVTYSDAPFTILAPANTANTSPEWLLQDEAVAEDVILNHCILGEVVRPETLMQPKVIYSSGGRKLEFHLDDEGDLWVNQARLVGWTHVRHGIIIAVEEYLFTDNPDGFPVLPREYTEPTKIEEKKISKEGWVWREKCEKVRYKNSFFKTVTVCTEELVDPAILHGKEEVDGQAEKS